MESLYRKHYRLRTISCILAVAAILLLMGTVYQSRQVKAFSQQTENRYMMAISDLCDYLDDIDVLIKKVMLSKDAKQISYLSTQIFMQTASAKMCISQLPLSDVNLEKTSKFLVQTGDYASFLSQKTVSGKEITEEEYKNLSALSSYAEKISESLEGTRDKIYRGEMDFVKVKETVSQEEDRENSLDGDFSKLENEFAKYPTLIYDGPFSEHMLSKKSSFLRYQGSITKERALEKVKNILGSERTKDLKAEDDGGVIDSYIFTKGEKEQTLSLAITKQGGRLLWMIDNRQVNENKISVNDAKLFAERFLKQAGFSDMVQSYYDKSGNVATLNFAYKQGDIIVYSDLIKVKVALDSGEILGVEAKGYLMNHSKREIPADIMSEADAEKLIGKHLKINGVSKALIPLNDGREELCYEFKGAFSDRNFLIYINAKTGAEEQILMLEESSDGILTI